MSGQSYSLSILGVDVREAPGNRHELVVRFQGREKPGEVRQIIDKTDVEGVLAGCEAIAQKIFHAEFRLNNKVDLNFSLEDENGMTIWHTKPSLFVRCPLTMTMKWSCHHLSQVYKTMTTLGVIELPSELPLTGNAIGLTETAQVIMDSMASGVEFMGNIMLMRETTVDHEALASGEPASM